MENKEQTKETGFTITSTKTTPVSFKKIPLGVRFKILFGGIINITTKCQIAVKQETEPIPVNDGIEIFINTKPDGKQ